MSQYVYGGKDAKNANLGSWLPSKQFSNLTYQDEESGFKSQLFERTVNGTTQFAYAFAGTDFTSLKDWLNNVSAYAGISDQYRYAIKNAQMLAKDIPNANLSFVGHSLGGGLAIAAALKTGRTAITFNPAWISQATIARYSLQTQVYSITNHIIAGEALDMFQTTNIFRLGLKNVGNNVYHYDPVVLIPGVGSIMAHSINRF